jgi:hypothetical protein
LRSADIGDDFVVLIYQRHHGPPFKGSVSNGDSPRTLLASFDAPDYSLRSPQFGKPTTERAKELCPTNGDLERGFIGWAFLHNNGRVRRAIIFQA